MKNKEENFPRELKCPKCGRNFKIMSKVRKNCFECEPLSKQNKKYKMGEQMKVPNKLQKKQRSDTDDKTTKLETSTSSGKFV